MDIERDTVQESIRENAEKHESAARNFLQARCVQLARMGCVVFQYDMIGYGDTTQIPIDIAHNTGRAKGKNRPVQQGTDDWLLYSARAELLLENVMGLQTWNSIRALDFLLEQEGVDKDRIACVGASGGATQSIMLAALDDRVKAVFAAVMISNEMQGGCTCENSPYLRIGTNNVEIAALMAPRPMALTSANDWTVRFETEGFPELQKVYELYSASAAISHRGFLQFGHNFNLPSREFLYEWLTTVFHLEATNSGKEQDFCLADRKDLSCGEIATASAGKTSQQIEGVLLRSIADGKRAQLERIKQDPERYREVAGKAWRVLLQLPDLRIEADVRLLSKTEIDTLGQRVDLEISGIQRTQSLTAKLFRPAKANSQGIVAFLPNRRDEVELGKLSFCGRSTSAVELMREGYTVMLLSDGDREAAFDPLGNVSVGDPEGLAIYTYCYNEPVFASKVKGLIDAIAVMRLQLEVAGKITLCGDGGLGAVTLAAAAYGQDPAIEVCANLRGFRFSGLSDIWNEFFVPGASKYGDVDALIMLSDRRPLNAAPSSAGGSPR